MEEKNQSELYLGTFVMDRADVMAALANDPTFTKANGFNGLVFKVYL